MRERVSVCRTDKRVAIHIDRNAVLGIQVGEGRVERNTRISIGEHRITNENMQDRQIIANSKFVSHIDSFLSLRRSTGKPIRVLIILNDFLNKERHARIRKNGLIQFIHLSLKNIPVIIRVTGALDVDETNRYHETSCLKMSISLNMMARLLQHGKVMIHRRIFRPTFSPFMIEMYVSFVRETPMKRIEFEDYL